MFTFGLLYVQKSLVAYLYVKSLGAYALNLTADGELRNEDGPGLKNAFRLFLVSEYEDISEEAND